MESPIYAIPEGVEFGLEALESSVTDNVGPNLIPQSVAGLLARQNIPLGGLLKNGSADSAVFLPSYSASSTSKVKLCPEHFGSNIVTTSWRHAIDQLESL